MFNGFEEIRIEDDELMIDGEKFNINSNSPLEDINAFEFREFTYTFQGIECDGYYYGDKSERNAYRINNYSNELPSKEEFIEDSSQRFSKKAFYYMPLNDGKIKVVIGAYINSVDDIYQLMNNQKYPITERGQYAISQINMLSYYISNGIADISKKLHIDISQSFSELM